MSLPEHNQHAAEQEETHKRRHASRPQAQPHGENPSATDFPVPLYADPEWIAANFPIFRRQILRNLRQQGHTRDRALEAFQEAVVVLYAKCPDKRTRRQVHHYLRQVAFQVADKAATTASRIELTAEPTEQAVASTAERTVEARLALRAVIHAVTSLPPRSRTALLRELQRELAELGVEDLEIRHTPQEPDEEVGSVGRARMRVARARQQLRARTRGWLIGVPLLRWGGGRDGHGMEGRALGLTAGAALLIVGVATVPPSNNRDRPVQLSTADELTATPRTSVSIPPIAAVPSPPSSPSAFIVRPATTAVTMSVVAAPPATPAGGSGTLILPNSYPMTEVGASRREPDNSFLVCAKHVPLVSETCVDHPLSNQVLER